METEHALRAFMALSSRARLDVLRLLVRVCAVVGGAFALTGLWDKIVHRLVTAATPAKAQHHRL